MRYAVLGLGCALAAVGYVARVALSQVGPEVKSDLHLTEFDWGLVMALFSFAYGAFEIPAGYAGDAAGARRTLTVAVLGFAAMTAMTGLAGGLAALLTARVAFGMFQSAIFPNLARMLTAWMPTTRRASAQGLIWMSTRIGAASAPALITWLVALAAAWAGADEAAKTGAWRTAFLLLSLPPLVWVAIYWSWYRDNPADARGVNAAEAELIRAGRPAAPAGHGDVPWRRLAGSRNLWALCAMYGCCGFTSFFVISNLPTFLRDHRGATAPQTAGIIAAAAAVGAIACCLSGRLSDLIVRRTGSLRRGRRTFGCIGFAGAGLMVGAFALTDDLWVLAALLCGMCFFNDLTMPISWAVCSDIGERWAGTVSGVMNTVGNIGAALGSLTAGALLESRQFGLLFALFGCSFFIASALWMRIDPTEPIAHIAPGLPGVG